MEWAIFAFPKIPKPPGWDSLDLGMGSEYRPDPFFRKLPFSLIACAGMRNLFLRGGLIVALFGAWFAVEHAFTQADETPSDTTTQAGKRTGVLVLKTGKLVEGQLSQRAGGYLVELPKGSYLVPFERVQVAAEDRHGAYEKLKASQPNPTPDYQVALARWCMAWKLHKEARLELRDALVADPNHKTAREMYARLHQLLHPDQQVVEKPKPKTREGFQASDPVSLSGLSPDLAKSYVVRVQPLLLNRCGNAACHGTASNQEFRLSHVRRGLNRTTLENLDTVLRYVDVTHPENSPLLKVPSGTHGRNGRPIFYGTAGEQNLETIQDWVTQVAKEQDSDSDSQPSKNPFARRTSDEQPDETLIRGTPEEPQPLTEEQRAEQEKEKLLNSILKNEQKDAFDPEEFNRKFGGQ